MLPPFVLRVVRAVLYPLVVAFDRVRWAASSLRRRFGQQRGRSGSRRGRTWRGVEARDAMEGFGIERWDDEYRYDPLEESKLASRGLASRESRRSTNVTFMNGLPDCRARLFWCDYQGKLVRYKTLAPGETHRQQTFETHPWTFTTVPDAGSDEPRRRLVVDGAPVYFPRASADESEEEEGRAVAVIERPPFRTWTRDTHRHFPAFYREVTRAFLLSHARLRRDAAPRAAFVETEATVNPEAEPERVRRSRRLREKRARIHPSGDMGPAAHDDDESFDAEEAVPEDARPGDGEDADAGSNPTTLGDLPPELAAYVVRLCAPTCPMYVRVDEAARAVDSETNTSSDDEDEDDVMD